ncbi:MAG TPA: hypothetical protein VN950_15950 [Terriglobales bacterium]|nr:hypothetical protein [Terriglobales bacterium]
MSLSSSISRFTDYFKRHGFAATVRRLGLWARRTLFSSRMVLFYCDLATQSLPTADMPSKLKVERIKHQSDLSPQDLKEITSFWNPKLGRRKIEERFELGAAVWLIKVEDNLAGYGWTLQGRTVEPHYFPLGRDDVQFLDFHVFPKYRGRALDWFLMTHILYRLAVEGRARAFGEAAEWNKASLSSFAMTPFRRLGWGRKFTVLGHTIVYWSADQPVPQRQASNDKLPARVSNRRTSQEKA